MRERVCDGEKISPKEATIISMSLQCGWTTYLVEVVTSMVAQTKIAK